jgi:hypothetical protein
LAGEETFDKPTARIIGKLFQAHLTDRPAWIEGGSVAVLRKVVKGHQANQYKLEFQGQSTGAKPEAAEQAQP